HTPTTQLYTLSLHDALPISDARDVRAKEPGRKTGVRRAWVRRHLDGLPRQVEPAPGAADAGRQHDELRDVRDRRLPVLRPHRGLDRKSTRLNSSHSQISYAV